MSTYLSFIMLTDPGSIGAWTMSTGRARHQGGGRLHVLFTRAIKPTRENYQMGAATVPACGQCDPLMGYHPDIGQALTICPPTDMTVDEILAIPDLCHRCARAIGPRGDIVHSIAWNLRRHGIDHRAYGPEQWTAITAMAWAAYRHDATCIPFHADPTIPDRVRDEMAANQGEE